ncbi:MAG: recombination-associated protein RdgC, partial [Pararheinheimera sp.]|nr:recombination-associated protein RdgC [Rheinheimera sp.]
MWFKNLRLYQVTENLNTDQDQLEQALAAFKFT